MKRRSGIAIAAAVAGLLAAAPSGGAAQFQGVVATVGGEAVQAAEVREELQETDLKHQVMGLSPREARQNGLERVMRRRLILLDVRKRKLLDGELGDRFRAIEVPALEQLYRMVRTREIVVTDRELDQVAPVELLERRRVRYIFNTSEEETRRALARVRAGEDFAALALEYSEGPASEKGGDLGWLERGTNKYFPDDHWKSILSLPTGGVTDVFPSLLQGWAIAKVEEIKSYPPEEVQEIRAANRGPLQEQKYAAENAQFIRESRLTLLEGNLQRLAQLDRLEPLATFDGGSVTAGVFRRYLERGGLKIETADPQQLGALLKDFAEKTVVAVKKAKTLDRNPEVAPGIKKGTAEAIFSLYLEPVYAGLAVTDAEVERYYREHPEENQSPEMVELWQLRVITQAEADEVYQRLKKGEDFEALVTIFAATEAERKTAGAMGWKKRADFAQPIADVVFALGMMEVSRPLATRFGYYVYQVRRRVAAAELTLQKREAEIRNKLLQDKKIKAYLDLFVKLQKTYPLKVDDAALDKI